MVSGIHTLYEGEAYGDCAVSHTCCCRDDGDLTELI